MLPYKKRKVRFLEIYRHGDWTFKVYILSAGESFPYSPSLALAKADLAGWLKNAGNYPLEYYKIGTLLLHETKEGVFAIISWWIDENMLQLHVYLLGKEEPACYMLYSDKGIVTCVWELAVLWFERNAWVEHVLLNPAAPDFEMYLLQQLNAEV